MNALYHNRINKPEIFAATDSWFGDVKVNSRHRRHRHHRHRHRYWCIDLERGKLDSLEWIGEIRVESGCEWNGEFRGNFLI